MWVGSSMRSRPSEILDDTLVYAIIGDNGASAEGTPNGCFNEFTVLNGASELETVEFMSSRIDDFGRRKRTTIIGSWAHAMDTPYQWTKQVASHRGGTRNGTIIRWPKGIKAKGEIRTQFPPHYRRRRTVLDVAGLPTPFVHGIQQMPLHGVSMAESVRQRRVLRGPRDPVFRDVLQSWHLPQGLDCGHSP